MLLFHKGKSKSLTEQERHLLKRQQAIEPVIGHLKADHRMNRCHPKGQTGDAIHATVCATRYKDRRMVRMIRKNGEQPFSSLIDALGLATCIRGIQSSMTINALFSFKTQTARAICFNTSAFPTGQTT
jgi:hypothetical protein